MSPTDQESIVTSGADEEQLLVYQAIVEASPAGMLMIARDGTIQKVNAQTEVLFGYERAELLGQKIEMLIPERFRGRHPAYRDGFFAEPRARAMGAGRDLYGLRKDGREFPVEIGLSTVEARGSLYSLASVIDISERKHAEELLRRQRGEIMELSTPVMQVWDRVLALPIIGTLDSVRAARLTESLLSRIASDEAAIVIVDISGVPAIDSAVAQHLFRTIQGARLMGAESIISGVRPETAQAMVHLGIDLGGIKSRSTLRDALQLALRMLADLRSSTAHAIETDGAR